MKPLRLLLVLFAVALLTCPGHASPESHRAAIERMLKVMKMDKQYETGMLAGFDAGLGLTAERLATLPEEQQTKLKAAAVKVRARMQELMGWDAVKGELVDMYLKKFSEEEAGAVIKMLDTPTGQMLIAKQVEIIPDTMAFGQKKAKEVMPEIVKMLGDEMK